MSTDRPGREIPQDFRDVVQHQIDTLGWRYDATGRGNPRLYPADITKPMITVPTTPGEKRSLRNLVAQVRGSRGTWPPEGKETR